MAGGTNHASLARGGVLWGMGFAPQITVPTNAANSVTLIYTQGVKEVVVGTALDMDGDLAASDANDQNAYLPGAMALQFEAQGTVDFVVNVIGRNQFGENVSELVTFGSSSDLIVYTNHCYSFVESMTPTVVTSWTSGDDLLVGFEHNDNVDCPYPLPFKPRNSDHVQAIAIAGNIFDGSDITTSLIYHTVTVANAASNITGLTELTPATISLVNGAAMTY